VGFFFFQGINETLGGGETRLQGRFIFVQDDQSFFIFEFTFAIKFGNKAFHIINGFFDAVFHIHIHNYLGAVNYPGPDFNFKGLIFTGGKHAQQREQEDNAFGHSQNWVFFRK
ncbi:uncharacterized protein METZ01_LOCUS6870, partial [marine metagenome]